MNIGDASHLSGLPAKTIRYYEEIGLIAPSRRENGYRDYDDADIGQLSFIQRARRLGFSVGECRDLLKLQSDKKRKSAQVKRIAKAHLEEVDHKIRELQVLRDTLQAVVQTCPGDSRSECPILDELASGGKCKH